MGNRATPDNSDEESGDPFTDGDFGDSEDDIDNVVLRADSNTSSVPVNDTANMDVNGNARAETNSAEGASLTKVNGFKNGVGYSSDSDQSCSRRDSHGDQNHSIVGILGGQQNHAEQRLAARRAARAEAREIRMRELERQQREQEDHADKAYDMYTGREPVARRAGSRLAMSPSLHSPRRASEDSAEEPLSVKDLRHELKEVEEKFRKAMILNAQLDNDKAALAYQLELMRDRLEELQEEHEQLKREHKEKCSSHERLKRDHAVLESEVSSARAAVRAREAAAHAAGYAFVDAASDGAERPEGLEPGVPALALVSHESQKLLDDAGEGTLDVRLQRLMSAKQSLESEVRRLKIQLHDERAARHNGVAAQHDDDYENELETLRKAVSEAKSRAARAEAEAALQAAGVARLEAQVARLRARQDERDTHEEALKQERRRLQREAREALNRVEELETENSHLTKRLDKLKNAKSALLKDL